LVIIISLFYWLNPTRYCCRVYRYKFLLIWRGGAGVAAGIYLLVNKIGLVALCLKCLKFKCDGLPTDKVVRYKNRPDLQSYDKWVF
jgi:hypothetical protein